jgi:UDP-GlcNAc:undecaprenyl-phosphate GlcNAc-1-phosphate transferase
VSGYLPIFGVVFAIALVISAAMTPMARLLGLRTGLVDRPGGRRQHAGAISRLGGIALYAGFTVAVMAILFLPAGWVPPRLDPMETSRLAGLLAGTGLIFLFGILDDRYQFSSWPQYLAQFLSCFIAIGAVIFIERVNNPLSGAQIVFSWPVVWLLTIFWFMGMMNTVNWLDGLDGLASGVGAIMSAFLAIHMFREGQLSVALLPVALLGTTLGFLPFNFNPAKVFMGSGGSYFLGWALAALGIIGGAKVATVLLVMGLPILDVAWLIFYRWRRGDKVSVGGRDHLHYRLLDLGFSPRQIVLGYYVWCAAFGALALWLDNRLYKLIALVVLGGVALTVFVWASRRSPASTPGKPGFEE